MRNIEYLPGDLVKYHDRRAKIASVERGCVTEIECKGHFVKNILTDIEPIPLSLAILKALEWKEKKFFDELFYYTELNCYSRLFVELNKKEPSFSVGILTDGLDLKEIFSYFPADLRYVHQLQRLLSILDMDIMLEKLEELKF